MGTWSWVWGLGFRERQGFRALNSMDNFKIGHALIMLFVSNLKQLSCAQYAFPNYECLLLTFRLKHGHESSSLKNTMYLSLPKIVRCKFCSLTNDHDFQKDPMTIKISHGGLCIFSM